MEESAVRALFDALILQNNEGINKRIATNEALIGSNHSTVLARITRIEEVLQSHDENVLPVLRRDIAAWRS